MKNRKNYPFKLMAAFAVVAVIIGLTSCKKNRGRQTPPPTVTYDGIDVSHHQGRLDWQSIAEDSLVQFVYIKATEGTSMQDKRFKENANGARMNGIKVGAYHVLSLTSSPETQVENFCKTVSRSDIDLIPALDIEEIKTKSKHSDRLLDYAIRISKLMESIFGRKPLIYTSQAVYNHYLHPTFENHYLWIAAYGRRCPTLKGNTRTNIWQYSERGRVGNSTKHVDLNCFVNGMTIDKLEL